jgi:4-methylaminobutanoate oxidase (formaldehyde-forming)
MYHEEPILKDGVIVGSIRSGAWGHRIRKSIGMGFVGCPTGVSKEWLAEGHWEVEVATKRYTARVQLEPLYDPKNERIKA